MKKLLFVVFVTTLCSQVLISQVKQETEINSNYQIGLGTVFTSYQDVKYSNVRYSGFGPRLSFGYEKLNNNYLSTSISLMYSSENAKTHDAGKTMVLNAVIDLSYLKSILNKENQKIYLGAKWDILDGYFRQTERLGNNGISYVFGSNLNLSSFYERIISETMKLRVGLNFQLISFMKESTSFGFSSPQDALEGGEYSYENYKLIHPLGFKHYSFEPFTKYLNTGTLVEIHYRKKWCLAYSWNMQISYEVKNYTLTRGYNSLSIKYQY